MRDSSFAECYSQRMGRPSIAPSLLAKVLLLQHRTGVSDEQAMGCMAWDLRWNVALNLAVDHQGWHPTSLTKYRARLLLHKKEGLALESMLRLAEELGMLDGTAKQIIDSTPMLGAAATQDTVRLVRHGVRKLIDAVAATDEHVGRVLDDGLEFDYAQPGEKPDCRWREKAERERMLTRVGLVEPADPGRGGLQRPQGRRRHREHERAYPSLGRGDRSRARAAVVTSPHSFSATVSLPMRAGVDLVEQSGRGRAAQPDPRAAEAPPSRPDGT